MNNMKYVSIVLTAVISAVSCTKQIENENPGQVNGQEKGNLIINAVTGSLGKSGSDTKAVGSFRYDILWEENDRISVTDGSGNIGLFELIEGAGETLGMFKQKDGPTLSGTVTGYYPASILQDDGTILWPAEQTYSKELTGIPMTATATIADGGTNFNFKSLGAVLQLVVSTTEPGITLDKIELSDTGKALSGAFDVTVGKAVIKEGEKGGIILDVNDSEIGVAARYFNLAVPAGKYDALTLKFYTNDGRAVTMTSSTMPEILHNTVAKVTLAVNGFSKYVQSISLDKSEISIIAGGHGRVNATLTPSDAGNKEIIWNSSDESVAKVIGNGSVIGVAPGTATITATTVDGGYSAQCEVSVTASAPRPDKTLPGVFSVGESKSVYFTKGNLKSDSHDFYFEEHQYDCPESISFDLDHLFWSEDPYYAYYGLDDDHFYDDDILFTNSTSYTPNESFCVDEIAGVFRTLANDEWSYLFEETDQRKGRHACYVTINDGQRDHVGCLVIAPDLCLNSYVFDAEKKYYSASEWAEAENAGLVCLPLTGVRPKERDIIDRTMGKGLYWASNCSGENGAYGVEIDNAGIEIQDMSRWQGMCIRLVADVKE